jgi:hypothetical protein
MSGRFCSPARRVFFICQAHPLQKVLDGLEGAAHRQGLAQFCQGQVGFAGRQIPQSLLVAQAQGRSAAGITVTGPQVAGVAALLEKFFNQAQGNPEAAGDFLASAFLSVVGGYNPFPQIQRDRFSHGQDHRIGSNKWLQFYLKC